MCGWAGGQVKQIRLPFGRFGQIDREACIETKVLVSTDDNWFNTDLANL